MALQITNTIETGRSRTSSSGFATGNFAFGNGIIEATIASSTNLIDLDRIGGIIGISGGTLIKGVSNTQVGMYTTGALINGHPNVIDPNKVLTIADGEYTGVANDDFIYGYGIVKIEDADGEITLDLEKVKGFISVNTGSKITVLSSDGLVISGQQVIATAAADNHSITAVLEPGDDAHTIRSGGGSILSATGKFSIFDNFGSNTNVAIFDPANGNVSFPIIVASGQIIEAVGGSVAYYDTTT